MTQLIKHAEIQKQNKSKKSLTSVVLASSNCSHQLKQTEKHQLESRQITADECKYLSSDEITYILLMQL